MVKIHPKLKKYVLQKLEEEIYPKSVRINGKELWIIDEETKNWYLQADSYGQLYFNKYFFKPTLDVFSLTDHQFASIIKEWFENNFEITIRNVARRQNNLDYLVDNVIQGKKEISNIRERNGFTFNVVKKYLDLKKTNKKVLVEDYLPFSNRI